MTDHSRWYPVAVEPQGPVPQLRWQDLSSVDLCSPFFEEAVRRARRERPQPRVLPLTQLDQEDLSSCLTPEALIFHSSRSGSTLLIQLLSCLHGTIAISEPPILDEILQLDLSPTEKLQRHYQVTRLLGQKRSSHDQHFFLKHDSWHLPWLEVIQNAFPAVPCFFVFRDPLEILWSHHREPGSQMVPGLRNPLSFDISPESYDPADLLGYAVRVLSSIFQRALPLVKQGNLIPVAYPEITESFFHRILPRIGIQPQDAEIDRIHQRLHFHSKRRGDPFQPEVPHNIPAELLSRFQERIPSELRAAYLELLEISRKEDSWRSTPSPLPHRGCSKDI